MKCLHCRGDLVKGIATFTDSRNGYVVVLHDVPAWICDQCGEPLFDATAVSNIQDIFKAVNDRRLKATACT